MLTDGGVLHWYKEARPKDTAQGSVNLLADSAARLTTRTPTNAARLAAAAAAGDQVQESRTVSAVCNLAQLVI